MNPSSLLRAIGPLRSVLPMLLGGLLSSALAVGRAPAVGADPLYERTANVWSYHESVGVPGQIGSLDTAPSSDQEASLAPSWSFASNVQVHPVESGQHLWPDIAVAPNGTVGVAWMDDHQAGGYHIYYSASTDQGSTWSTPEKVDTRVQGAYSKFVSLAFTPSNLPLVVWEDDRTNGVYNLYFSKRDPDNGGAPWTANLKINTAGSPPSGGDYMNGSVAVLDEGRYFVAWTDWREGVFHQVYFRRTTDGGNSWGVETRVSDGLGYEPVAADPCLLVDPTSGPVPGTESLYCVMNDWRGNVPGGRFPNAYFYRSTDGGNTWSVGVQVNDVEPYFQQVSSRALVRLDDGTLTAGWLNDDFDVTEFRASVSTDLGATWEPSVQIDSPSVDGPGTYSSIAAYGNWVYGSFDVYQADSWNVYFRASYDGGRTWPEAILRMDDDPTNAASGNTVLAAGGSNLIYGAWQDTRPGSGAWKIYTARGVRSAADAEPPSIADSGPEWRVVCSPNPSNRASTVRIELLRRGYPRTLEPSGVVSLDPGAILRIFDCDGQCVRALRQHGTEAFWDGRDHRGHPAPPGIYWAKFEDAGQTLSARSVRVP